GAGEDGVDIHAQAHGLADPEIVERLLLDIRSEPDIVDALELSHRGAGDGLEILLGDRLDALEIDLSRLEGDIGGLLLDDRLADDLLEEGLDRALVVRVGLEHELLAWRPALEEIGAAADRGLGELVAERLEGLLRDDAPRSVGEGDDPERRR